MTDSYHCPPDPCPPPCERIFIECVIICVNFADILAHTLPLNRNHFDKLVVVRDSRDQDTWNLCRHWHVECVTTDEFYGFDGELAFAKGNGINAGLKKLSKRGWVVHMDADILLPPRFRELVERVVRPREDTIYGIDRVMCPGFREWIAWHGKPETQHADEIFVIPPSWPLGPRIARLDGEGYVPIGFFQMWHPGVSGVSDYPTQHGTAGRTDMLHSLRWARDKRALIPEIFAVHLQGDIEPGMTNWRGRKMERFGL